MNKPNAKILAQKLVEVRARLEEVDEVYKGLKAPLEQERAEIAEQLIELMRKDETLSTSYDDFRIARKKTVKAVIMNEYAAIDFLRQHNPNYISESISPAALEQVKKGTLAIDGVQREEKEYISVTQNKTAEQQAA